MPAACWSSSPDSCDRRAAAGGDRVAVDQGGRQGGVPRLHDHRGRAKQQDPQQAEQPRHVTGREKPEMPGARAVQRVDPGRRLGHQGPVRVLHALGIGRGARGVHEHRPVVRVRAGPPVAAARLTEQVAVADRPVTGRVVFHDDGQLQPRQRRQPGKNRVRLRPAPVRTGEHDRAGSRAPQHEVHLPRAVDHHHRQQHRPAQAHRHLDDRSRVGAGQLNRDHVAAADAARLQRPGDLLGVAHQPAERRRVLAVGSNKYQRAAVVSGGALLDVGGQRRLVHR